jgi:hypothetical protein
MMLGRNVAFVGIGAPGGLAYTRMQMAPEPL